MSVPADVMTSTANQQFVPPQPVNSPMPPEWANIEAIPLKTTDISSTRCKPQWYGHWVVFKLGDKESPQRFREAMSQGFIKAQAEHVEICPYWDQQEKAYLCNEYILMVMPMEQYQGHAKHNWLAANGRINKGKAGSRPTAAEALEGVAQATSTRDGSIRSTVETMKFGG